MTIKTDVVRAAANTSTGNQDFTGSLGGDTPNAALFIISRAVTDATAAAHAILGIGAATATTERWATVAPNSEDGVGSTDDAKRIVTNQCIAISNPGLNSNDGVADFVSFIANGVRVNWGNAPASAYLVTVVLFSGLTNAFAGTYAPGTTVDADVDVTAPGFEPDILALGSANAATSSTNSTQLSLGFAVNDGSDTQQCSNVSEEDGQASGQPTGYLHASRGAIQTDAGSGNLEWQSQIGTFDASGFTSTLRSSSAGSDIVGYLALEVGALNFWLGGHDTPTSTGSQASTAPGFTPQLLLGVMTHLTATGTTTASAEAGAFGITAIVSGTQVSNAVAIEDGAATTDTQSLSDDQAVNLPQDDGSTGHTATFTSFDANGWTWNFSNTLGSARKWIMLALEQDVAVTVPLLDEEGLTGGLQPLAGGLQ